MMDNETYPKMDRGAKRRWIKALRSGKYQQARGTLVKRIYGGETKGYCCLGVYCEISTRVKRDNGYYVSDGSGFGYISSTFMPEPLREAIKLDAEAQDTLIAMNDREYKSFAEIADWIEANL